MLRAAALVAAALVAAAAAAERLDATRERAERRSPQRIAVKFECVSDKRANILIEALKCFFSPNCRASRRRSNQLAIFSGKCSSCLAIHELGDKRVEQRVYQDAFNTRLGLVEIVPIRRRTNVGGRRRCRRSATRKRNSGGAVARISGGDRRLSARRIEIAECGHRVEKVEQRLNGRFVDERAKRFGERRGRKFVHLREKISQL